MKRLLYILMIWLCHLSAFAQTDGYNPSNPPSPSVPDKDTTTYYHLSVVSMPEGIGSFNTMGGDYAAGTSIYLYAYNHDYCEFKRWRDEDGNTLSTNYRLYYTMPAKDVKVVAEYDYNPSNPANPDVIEKVRQYTLTLKSKPEAGGTFSPNGSVTINGGDSRWVYAYANTGFYFQHWEDEDGQVLSTDGSYYVTMPSRNTTLYGVFKYDPASPGNPGKNAWDEFLGQVVVDDFTPGKLSSAISNTIGGSSNASKVSQIIVAGKINQYDFSIANNYSNCTMVDFSRTTGATVVPSYCYSGNTKLNQILLPASIKEIQYAAFNNCSDLTELTCLAVTPPTVGSNAFAGVAAGMVVRVPEASIELYEASEAWNKFDILPILANVHSLELNLPAECSDGRYKNMSLELVNIKSGQKYKYVVTDRLNYIFSNLMKNTTYNAYLKNLSGVVLAQLDSIHVDNEDLSLTFSDLKSLQTVSLQVLDAQGQDVTAQTSVKWYDETGRYLAQGTRLDGQVEESRVRIAVTLSEALGMQYLLPADSIYTVEADGNQVVFRLQPIPQLTLKGNLYDLTTGLPLSDAVVTVTQTLNGLYTQAVTVKSDNLGSFQMQVKAAPSVINYALNDYVSQTVELAASEMTGDVVTLQDVKMKSIVGARITLNYSYRNSVLPGAEAEVQGWYTNYNNVSYAIYDKTARRPISQFNVQYPNIVLLEEVATGDVLEVTATSKTNSFMPVKAEGRVDSTNNVSVSLPVVQLGGIKATFNQTENNSVVSMLYDPAGNLLGKYDYSAAGLSISNLPDTTYTLVTMGKSSLFNSFSSLAGFDEAGLVQNTDYVRNEVSVQSGVISAVKNVVIPFFDESKLYYTGEGTLFSVNKAEVVAGNYLTLQAKVDFKSVYQNQISDVELVFPIPDGMSFVDNSMMVGSQQSVYQQENGVVTVQLESLSAGRVRFCVIPTKSGNYAPNAFVRFKYGDETIQQPIGTANCKVKDLTISVPSVIPTDELTVRGVAPAKASVTLYDGSDIIGTTTALANGSWVLSTRLVKPYNLSVHPIFAEVLSKDGNKIVTETKECEYNVTANHVKTVTMSFYNGWYHKNMGCVWDFEKKTVSETSYSFYTTTDFTFITDFANNSPEQLSDVYVIVYGSDGSKVKLPATYNAKLDKWVANKEFSSSNLPVNVNVGFTQTGADGALSPEYLSDAYGEFAEVVAVLEQSIEQVDNLRAQIEEELAKDAPDFSLVEELYRKYHALLGVQEIPYTDGDLMTDEEVEALKAQFEAFKQKYGGYQVEELLKTALRNISYKGTDEEHGLSYQIAVSTCDGYTESSLGEDFNKFMTTDGKCFYVQVLDGSYLLLDFENDLSFKIVLTENGQASKAADNRSFAEKMKGHIDWIVENINTVRDLTQKALDVIEDVKDHIDRGIQFAQEGYGAAYIQLMRLERMEKSGQYVNPVRKALLNMVCEGYETEIKGLKGLKNGVSQLGSKVYAKIFGGMGIVMSFIECKKDLESFIDLYFKVPDPCKDDQEKADAIKTNITVAGISAALYYVGNITADVASLLGIGPAVASAPATAGSSLGVALAAIGKLALSYGIQKAYEKMTNKFKHDTKRDIRRLKCYVPDDDDDDDNNDDEPPFDPIRPILDPSGYVYEGVSSNRLQGVTATCYYKETVEDMYGDLHENVVLWDAEEYAQKNPLFTDENGMYAWDVPQGLWQVKFEKEGYQTTYSEWLPVPPPQLEVNIAMVQNAQPEVTGAKAYEDGVEINFSKYMKPATLTADNLYLKLKSVGNEQLLKDVTIELLDGESVSEDDATNYASKVAIRTTEDLGLANEVYVIVSGTVESYAGIAMGESFSQKLDVVKKVREIKVDETLNVGYEQQETLLVGVLPGDASKGKTLVVTSGSDMIASVDGQGTQRVTLDENGQASIQVSGELYGSTALTFSVEDADVTAQTMVNVVDPAKLQPVKDALASRISGTQVYRGQTVTLSCETEGATIYYTTDGSCPCDEASRIKYEGKPIAINGDMVIKAMAVGINGSESEVKEYSYSIKTTSMKLNLSEGWNWISHNQDADIAVADLQQDYVNRILSQEGELYNDPKLGFVGRMDDFQATQSIKVQTKQQATYALSGEQFNPSAKTIDLVTGWNWMGYPVEQVMALDEALAYLDADEGDCLASIEGGFAEYANGSWTGMLTTMTPGQGYLYKSASTKSFIYRDDIVSKAKALNAPRLETQMAPWTVNVHAHSNMMCLTAELIDNGSKAADDAYFVAAFAGEECRGLGKFVNGRLYLAVYGTKANETIRFRAVNRENGDEWGISETLSFTADKVGSWLAPVQLNLGEPTGIHEVTASGWQGKAIYNLMGIRVKSLDREGVYIINGTKVMINKQNVNQYVQ